MVMMVYSYYYGAIASRGIGIQAQSPELERLPIHSALKDLASMQPLNSSEHSGEMLSFLLSSNGYSILGMSYSEPPKSSGYNRSAPCSLQYITSEQDMYGVAAELGKIVNFVNFQKPAAASPAPLRSFPMNASGYYYHNSVGILSALVDGLARVALSAKHEVLLVGLPKGKNSEYATARYTIAEALNYLPISIRTNIRFFTGLPVQEGVTDPLSGFDNAVKFGANVIFCPNEYYTRLKSFRTCLCVDMDNPGGPAGIFASYVTGEPDASQALSLVVNRLGGTEMTYDKLNKAAQYVQQGNALTYEMISAKLTQSEARNKKLERSYSELVAKYNDLVAKHEQSMAYNADIQREIKTLKASPHASAPTDRQAPLRPPVRSRNYEPEEESSDKLNKLLRWIITILAVLMLIVAAVLAAIFVKNHLDNQSALPASTVISDPHTMATPTIASMDNIDGQPTAAIDPEVTASIDPAITATIDPAATATIDPAATATIDPEVTATIDPSATATPTPSEE